MPRRMPGLQAELHSQIAEAMKLAEIGEVARAEAGARSQTRKNLHHSRVELLYELAFLRMFLAWEVFLEQSFLRYLCGYSSRVGAAVPATGVAFSASLVQAEAALLKAEGRRFLLWHNPTAVADRSQRMFKSCPVETVLRSSVARLDALAAIRHRVAHGQADARRKFDTATMAIAGKRYRGARPGAFLRDWDASVAPATRWIEQLGRELQGLALQIA